MKCRHMCSIAAFARSLLPALMMMLLMYQSKKRLQSISHYNETSNENAYNDVKENFNFNCLIFTILSSNLMKILLWIWWRNPTLIFNLLTSGAIPSTSRLEEEKLHSKRFNLVYFFYLGGTIETAEWKTYCRYSHSLICIDPYFKSLVSRFRR